MSDHDDDEWDEKKDLTRLEDLSEFLHIDDPDVEEAFKVASDNDNATEGNNSEPNSGEDLSFDSDNDDSDNQDEASTILNLNDLEDDEFPPLPSNENQENDSDEGDAFGTSDDFSFDSNKELSGEEDGEDFGFNSENEDIDEDEVKTDPAFDTSDFESSSFEGEGEGDDNDDFDNEDPLRDSDTYDSEENDNEVENEINEDSSFEDPEQESQFSSFEDSDSDQDGFSNLEEDEEDEPEELFPDQRDNYCEPGPEPKPEAQAQSTAIIDSDTTMSNSLPREDFQDLRDFGNAISYGMVKAGGNPPYTLILRNVKYREDAADIMILLREHGLVTEENENLTEQGLQNGHLLISQISEYSAIYLAHRMRRFDVQIRIGLSEQLHPSKSYTQDNKGLVSKYNLRQDRRESVEMQKNMVDIDDIIMATTSGLEGYDVLQYIKVLSTHHLISELELQLLHEKSQSKDRKNAEDTPQYAYESFHGLDEQNPNTDNDQAENDSGPIQRYALGLEDIYNELAEELRNLAYKNEANAVLGLSYSISPIIMPSLNNDRGEMHYKITCTGNAVWISDRP